MQALFASCRRFIHKSKRSIKKIRWLSPFFLFVCLLFASAGIFLQSHLDFAPEEDSAVVDDSQLQYVITYGEGGFIPAELEIPVGSRVIFENTSSIPMWPASDPHPLHNDFSAFDAGREYFTNDAYSFDFTSQGVFGFHNHMRSSDRGVIRVIDYENPVPDISKTKSSQQAIRNTLIEMLDPHDADSIFKAIDTIEADPSLAVNCHDIAHDLGHIAYELYGFSGAMTYNSAVRGEHASVQDVCAGGYVHGILEEVFLFRPELIASPNSVCDPVPTANRASCFHGVGHAVTFAYTRNIESSLAACRNIESKYDQTRCFEGVWMEIFWGNTEHTGEGTLGWDLDKPLQPCIDTPQDAKPACYIYAPFGYLRSHQKDYAGAAQLCITEGITESDTHFCLRGVGIAATSNSKGQHLEKVESYAVDLSHLQKQSFYEGVIGYARLSGISDGDLESICALLVTDAQVCAEVIVNYR